MKRTTIFLPDDLHEQLRDEAFHARISMAELIRSRLKEPTQRRKKPRRKEDVLAKLEGIIQDGTLTQGIDEDLYDL